MDGGSALGRGGCPVPEVPRGGGAELGGFTPPWSASGPPIRYAELATPPLSAGGPRDVELAWPRRLGAP